MKDMQKSKTFRLFKVLPSFGSGFSSMVDVSKPISEKFNVDVTERRSDYKALESDWKTIGFDMSSAIKNYERSRT